MIKWMLFLILTFSISGIAATNLEAQEHRLDEHIAQEFGMPFALNYLEASRVHDEMWVLFPRSQEGELVYPTYYGGHFFCDKGGFVFKVVGSLMAEAQTGVFAELLKKDSVEVRAVEFSHLDLISTLNAICHFVSDNPDNELKIATWGLDTPGNIVVVQMQKLNEETEAAFKRDVIDSPMVTLEEGGPVKTLVPQENEEPDFPATQEVVLTDSDKTSHLQPGGRIYINNFGFSAGYPAERKPETGFVTALHGLPLEEQEVRLGSQSGPVIGDVTGPIHNGGSADGAFIAMHQSLFDRTVDNRTLLHSDMRPAHGMILTSVSTPPDNVTRTQRNVVVTNSNFRADLGGGLVLTDMIQTTGHALYGESGGIVFRPIGSDAQVKGVIVGSDGDSVTGDNMFFSWSETINREINVTQP